MKKLLALFLTLAALNVYADEKETFKDIAKAAAKGKPLTFVVDINLCTSSLAIPDKFFSIRPSALMVNNDRITFSNRHFTMNHPSMIDTPIFEHSKYNISADGKVGIKITVMKTNYEKLQQIQLDCILGKGFKAFA